jgi:hypothetical protein
MKSLDILQITKEKRRFAALAGDKVLDGTKFFKFDMNVSDTVFPISNIICSETRNVSY